MTSLLARLRKLNKEATKTPWEWEYAGAFGKMGEAEIYGECEHRGEGSYVGLTSVSDNEEGSEKNADLIVECRNSLPAVLNAIDLLRRLSEWDALAPPVQAPFGDGPFWKREIDAALEPFMEETP